MNHVWIVTTRLDSDDPNHIREMVAYNNEPQAQRYENYVNRECPGATAKTKKLYVSDYFE